MKEESVYKHKYKFYGDNAKFLYRKGKLTRITNDPNEKPKYFEPIIIIKEEEWVDFSKEHLQEELLEKSLQEDKQILNKIYDQMWEEIMLGIPIEIVGVSNLIERYGDSLTEPEKTKLRTYGK